MRFRRYDCATVREMLPLHVGGDLEERHAASVDGHLHACLNCFREYRELATARGRLAALADEPLPEGILVGFADDVMAAIRRGEARPAAVAPRARIVGLPLRRMLAAAAVVVAAGLAVTLVLDRPGTSGVGASDPGALSPEIVAGSAQGDFDPTRGWPAPGVRGSGGRAGSGATPAADHGGGARRSADARAFGLDESVLERMLPGPGLAGTGSRLVPLPSDPTALGAPERLHMVVVPESRLLELTRALELVRERRRGAAEPETAAPAVPPDAPDGP